MKAKLIKVNDIYTLMDGDKMIASSDSDFQTDYEVMKLSKQNCDEIFGVVDVEKLAYETYEPETFVNHSDMYRYLCIRFFKEGFNKAMELQKDKLFTVEDLKKSMDKIVISTYCNKVDDVFDLFIEKNRRKYINEYIQSLQQPTEIEVEIEMTEDYLTWKKSDIEKMSDCLVPKLDKDGCLILIKKK
jgi:hypothetical protein